MRQSILHFVAVLVAVSACATTRYEEYGPPPESETVEIGSPDPEGVVVEQVPLGQFSLDERVARLETVVLSRLDDLEAADSDLATRLVALAEQVVELKKEVARLNAWGPVGKPAKPSPAAVEPARTSTPKSAPQSASSVNRIYEQALSDFDRQQYDAARKRFEQVLQMAPSGNLGDNAHYWIGECHYAGKNYRAALASFQNVFQFSDTEKDDDAQLKLGYTYLQLGELDNALIEFKRLIVDYPRSEYLPRAEEQVRRIRDLRAARP